MVIRDLKAAQGSFSKKEQREVSQLNNLINHLNNREIPETLMEKIDEKIAFLNGLQEASPGYIKNLKLVKQEILKWLKKELELVPEKYYTNYWTTLGMTVFGLPIGVVFFASTNNAAFIGIGLPIGLAIGSAHGASLDKKAKAENRVLKM